MNEEYFIMIWAPRKGDPPIPMMTEDDGLAIFRSYDAAEELAENHQACQAWGYEIHKMGGVCCDP